MRSLKSIGRAVGVLLLLHLATGLIIPYVLLQRFTSIKGFLENAAGLSFRFRIAVLLLFVGGAVPIAVVTVMWPLLREYSYSLGLWLLALAVVNLSLQGIENAHWMSLLSLSQDYANAGTADMVLFQGMAGIVRSAWKWAHYTHLLVVVSWIFLLCGSFYRWAIVPRLLAAIGMAAALSQLFGITLPQFVGYRVPFPELFGVPLGLIYLIIALWLIGKGFYERSHRTPSG